MTQMGKNKRLREFVESGNKIASNELEELKRILNELEKQDKETVSIRRMEYYLFE